MEVRGVKQQARKQTQDKQLDSAGMREMLGCTDLVQEKEAAGSVWWHRVPEGGCECKAVM